MTGTKPVVADDEIEELRWYLESSTPHVGYFGQDVSCQGDVYRIVNEDAGEFVAHFKSKDDAMFFTLRPNVGAQANCGARRRSDMSARKALDHNYQAGAAAVEAGDYQGAIRPLRKALKAMPQGRTYDPHRGAMYRLLATALSALGQQREAIDALRQWARYNPDDANAHFGLGLAMFTAKQYKASVKPLSRAAELEPDNAPTWRYIGLAHLRRNEVEEAHQALSRYLELEPNAEDDEIRAFCQIAEERDDLVDAIETFPTLAPPDSGEQRVQ